MIFAAIAALLGKIGFGEAFAKKASPFVFLAALLAVLAGGFGLWLHFHDRGVVEHAVTKANNKVLERTIETNETAYAEQSADEAALAEMRKGFNDALHSPPPGASADARVRLACQRLRNAGYREADLPASCGHAGGGGSGAEAHP